MENINIIVVLLFLIISSLTDIKNKQIYIIPSMVFALVGFIINACTANISAYSLILGVITGLLLIVIGIISKGKIGIGDGIVVAILGIFLGFERNILTLILALMLSSTYSIGLILIKKYSKTYTIPFVPFITGGFLICTLL